MRYQESTSAALHDIGKPAFRWVTPCLIGLMLTAGCGGAAEDTPPHEVRRCYDVPREVVAEIDLALEVGEVAFAQAVAAIDPHRYVIAAEVTGAEAAGAVVVTTWIVPSLEVDDLRLTALSEEAQRLSAAPAASAETGTPEADREAASDARECLRTAIRPEPTPPAGERDTPGF